MAALSRGLGATTAAAEPPLELPTLEEGGTTELIAKVMFWPRAEGGMLEM